MDRSKSYIDIAFLSTYPPHEGEIATFTADLITTMDYTGLINTHVIAINNSTDCSYDKKVIAQIRQNEKSDYINLARKLNTSKIKLLVIEHDYKLYGGEQGDYVLDLVNNLEIPVVTILHQILTEPNPKQKFILQELGTKSEKLITMAHNTKEMLQLIYGINIKKIDVIHHGVPKKQFEERELLKKKYGYLNRQVISTFNLTGHDNGIEYGIEAIAKIIKGQTNTGNHSTNHKDVMYIILGQTRTVLNEEGITYRAKLQQQIDQLGIQDNVRFVNRSLDIDETIHFLQLSDIYMTPYLAKDLAVNTEFAYAVGYGKTIISTPYLYAKEMLSNGNGLLVDYKNSDALAYSILQILENPFKKSKIERNIMKIGRTMYWDKVVSQYTSLFLSIISSASDVGEV